MALPDALAVTPLTRPPVATIQVPGSKSITNRALVLAALSAKGYACALRGVLRSEDTEVMIEALRALGFRVLTEWPQSVVFVSSGEEEPRIPARQADLFVANSGTTMRFLTALVCLGHGRYRLDGVTRMRERPIEDLLDALRQLGWGPVLLGLVDRIEAALKSNLAPADLGKLSPRARRLLARIRREEK